MSAHRWKHPHDPNQLAYQVMLEFIERAPGHQARQKHVGPTTNPHAFAMGRLGGLKLGAVWAENLMAEKRSEIEAKATCGRWEEK